MVQNYADKIKRIKLLLDAMGYQHIEYKEGDGRIAICGYDAEENYFEATGISIFTINDALANVERMHKTYTGLLNNGLKTGIQGFMERYNALSPEERRVLDEGFAKIREGKESNGEQEDQGEGNAAQGVSG